MCDSACAESYRGTEMSIEILTCLDEMNRIKILLLILLAK